MSIFISCGEVSGDLYAADLISELLLQKPSLHGEIWGVLGQCGVSAGGKAEWSYEELKLMGIVEILPAIPRILKLRNAIAKKIIEKAPSIVVVIDSPDFHLSLVKRLRKLGYKGRTVCLVTPSVWAWRSGRTKLLRDMFDLCLPLFSFEHDFLLSRGVKSMWKSHPLVETLSHYKIPPELSARYSGQRVAAFMPGSRFYDIKFHLDRLLAAAKITEKQGYLPVFSITPGLSEPLKKELAERTAGFEVWTGEGRHLMMKAEAVVGVSGTVSVEAMLLQRFMVVIYNGKGLSWLLARAMVRIPYISIPNYLAEKPMYPELLKDDATPERIAEELMKYLENSQVKLEADRLMEQGRASMGTERSAAFWVKCLDIDNTI